MTDSSGGHSLPLSPADVCIIGAGPAGALAANSLANRGHDVVVLEAGKRFNPEDRLQRMKEAILPAVDDLEVWDMGGDRDDFVSRGSIAYPLNHRRVKGVGGSTLHWGGTVARLHEKDFEMQSRYGLASDWPIDYEDLRPYYAQAEEMLGVAGGEDNPFSPPRRTDFPMEAFPPSYSDRLFASACERLGFAIHSTPQARNSETYQDRSVCQGFGTCSPICPSGAKYSADYHIRRAERAGARIIDQAPVQRLEHDDSGTRVETAVYAREGGGLFRQEAASFLLACGGVEIPRLLLLSRSAAHPDGLANSSGLVGRYFSERPYAGVQVEVDQRTRQHEIGFHTSESHQFYDHSEPTPGSFKLEFSNTAGVSPADIALNEPNVIEDAFHSIQSFTSARDIERFRTLLEGAQWGDELLHSVRNTFGNSLAIRAEIEPLPVRDNRVALHPTKEDRFGNPVPVISWNREPHAMKTINRAIEVMNSIFDSMDLTIRSRSPWEFWRGVGHHLGTTRMGADPSQSVVDPNLQTHDLQNLFVASSSVFVTFGAMQPTLTIAALALLAADRIDDVL